MIKFLSSRGLAFRGDTELLCSTRNGYYMGILELIAEYDPFISSHLAKYGNQGRGKPSYLSSTICEEVIQIMGDKVYKRSPGSQALFSDCRLDTRYIS